MREAATAADAPGLGSIRFIHAGAPIEWEQMCELPRRNRPGAAVLAGTGVERRRQAIVEPAFAQTNVRDAPIASSAVA